MVTKIRRERWKISLINWTRDSRGDQFFSHIWVSLPEAKSHKSHSRLRKFGEAIFAQRIQQRQKL